MSGFLGEKGVVVFFFFSEEGRGGAYVLCLSNNFGTSYDKIFP